MATGGERDRVPEMGRIRDKRKMREKKGGGGGAKEIGAVMKHKVCATSICGKRKENPKSVRILRERRSIALSLESIDRFGIPKGRRTTIGALR